MNIEFQGNFSLLDVNVGDRQNFVFSLQDEGRKPNVSPKEATQRHQWNSGLCEA